MSISVDPTRLAGPVPALRGLYVGDSDEPFVEEDVARLKEEIGATCIRYGIQPRSLADEQTETYHEAGFREVGAFLDWCQKYGIHCILDLHNALGRLFGGDPRLWREQYFQGRFVALWEEIARRFRDHPAVAAYEFLNEPEPPDTDFAVWNRLQQRTAAAVRQIDPDRTFIVDSIGYAKPQHFSGLEPSGDPNTVYSFHNYQPGPYHCQKRRELMDQSTYAYPGFIPHKRPDGNPQDFSLAHFEPTEAKHWNRRQLLEEWAEVFAFRDRHGAPLFCGEFGCVSDVPEMTDMIYLMDEIGIFQEEGISWTLYNTMYRTRDPYWKTHFDCGVYIYYSPDGQLFRFGRKIALMEFFCRTEGDVLSLAQPADEWVGIYGARRPDGDLALLVSNKSRQERKDVELSVAGLPARWAAGLKTMGIGDEGFVSQPARVFEGGALTLPLPPLSLALVDVPAGAERWYSRRA